MLDYNLSSGAKIVQEEPMIVCNELPAFNRHNEWSYSMRRNMQEIIPGVFLGPFSSAQKASQKSLRDHGITHIVCVRQDLEAQYIKPQLNDINYLTLDIADTLTENIIRFFPKVKQFIDDAHARNGKVLVHGNQGTSRSATLVLAYVMEKFGVSCMAALDLVKKRRMCVHPNEAFIAQLTEYEPIYKARQTLDRGGSSNERRQKRKSEHLSECVDYEPLQPPPSPVSDDVDAINGNGLSVGDLSNNLYNVWLGKH